MWGWISGIGGLLLSAVAYFWGSRWHARADSLKKQLLQAELTISGLRESLRGSQKALDDRKKVSEVSAARYEEELEELRLVIKEVGGDAGADLLNRLSSGSGSRGGGTTGGTLPS